MFEVAQSGLSDRGRTAREENSAKRRFAVSTLITDAVTQLSFALFENKGVFALLLGSGLSRAAEIPTGWEITLDLIRCVSTAQGINAQPDWAKWYHDKTGQHPSYSTLLQELAGSS